MGLRRLECADLSAADPHIRVVLPPEWGAVAGGFFEAPIGEDLRLAVSVFDFMSIVDMSQVSLGLTPEVGAPNLESIFSGASCWKNRAYFSDSWGFRRVHYTVHYTLHHSLHYTVHYTLHHTV